MAHLQQLESDKNLPTILIRRMEPHRGAQDPVTRFKGSWIGRYYADHLKQIPLIRRLVILLWRTSFPVYCHIVARCSMGFAAPWRPLVKLADFVEASSIPTIKVFDAVRVDTPPPKVIPAEDQAYLVPPHEYYEFPPIYVAQLSDAQVNGGTNLVFMEETVICHDLYDFERDYTSEELHGRHVIDAKKKRIRRLKSDVMPEQVPVAAAFLDACAPNYAHWMTEVLPRIAAFCSIELYANVPIIVDDALHPNIIESLALVAGNAREIIVLPIGRAVSVGVLYCTSVTGYVPFERRNATLSGHSHGLFCPLALELLKKRLLIVLNEMQCQDFPKKVYLRRVSGGRKITNGAEVEEILVNNGYAIVEPEKLTFLQQVALFGNLEELVAPSGAALANQIFVPVEARVHILIGKYDGTSYWYWQNMACASGGQVFYSLGELSDRRSAIHSDFVINPEVFIMHANRSGSGNVKPCVRGKSVFFFVVVECDAVFILHLRTDPQKG